MTSTAELLERAHQGLRLHISGEHDAARSLLQSLWDELGNHGNPLIRCCTAHYLADLQTSAECSLQWNLLARQEADRIADPDGVDAELGVSGRQLYPSLLLNLCEDYRKLGRRQQAHEVLEEARLAVSRSGPAAYAAGIGAALDGVADRLAIDATNQAAGKGLDNG